MIYTTLLPLFALVNIAVADPIRMPLIRKNSLRSDIPLDGILRTVNQDKMAAHADFVRQKWGFASALAYNKTKRAQTVGIPVVNQVSLLPLPWSFLLSARSTVLVVPIGMLLTNPERWAVSTTKP